MYPKIVKFRIYHPQNTHEIFGVFRANSFKEIGEKKIELLQINKVHGKPIGELGYKVSFRSVDAIKLVRRIKDAIRKSESAKRTNARKAAKSGIRTARMRELPEVYKARHVKPTR
jgi:hypothetical protein